MPKALQKEIQEKRRKYIENRTIGGMNKKRAALEAGFSLAMATNASARIETPEVLAAIESRDKALLDGIPNEVLVRKFAERLEAKVPKAVHRNRRRDTREFPDCCTRLERLEKIAVFSGRHEPGIGAEHTGKDGGPIELSALTYEQLKQRKQWLERQLGIDAGGEAAAGNLPAAPAGGETD